MSNNERTLAYALEHLLCHYLHDVDEEEDVLMQTSVVRQALAALADVGCFPIEEVIDHE